MNYSMKILKEQRGFGMAQVMVALGVTSIITLGVTAVLSSMQKHSSAVFLKNDIQDYRAELIEVLKVSQVCTSNLLSLSDKERSFKRKKGEGEVGGYPVFSEMNMQFERIVNGSGGDILKKGSVLVRGRTVEEISLASFTEIVPEVKYSGDFRILFKHVEGQLPMPPISLKLNLKASKDEEGILKFIECTADETHALANQLAEICLKFGGVYNDKTDNCSIASSILASLGSCGLGEVMTGANADGTARCRNINDVINEAGGTKFTGEVAWSGVSNGHFECARSGKDCTEAFNKDGATITCGSQVADGSATCGEQFARLGKYEKLKSDNTLSDLKTHDQLCAVVGRQCTAVYSSSGGKISCTETVPNNEWSDTRTHRRGEYATVCSDKLFGRSNRECFSLHGQAYFTEGQCKPAAVVTISSREKAKEICAVNGYRPIQAVSFAPDEKVHGIDEEIPQLGYTSYTIGQDMKWTGKKGDPWKRTGPGTAGSYEAFAVCSPEKYTVATKKTRTSGNELCKYQGKSCAWAVWKWDSRSIGSCSSTTMDSEDTLIALCQ